MVKHQFIAENIELIRRLVRSGDMNGSTMAHYKIYLAYQNTDSKKDKMDRYEDAAEASGCSARTVQRAVNIMLVKI